MEGLANLGIDIWGLVLYLVNFGLLALILTKFLYKPLLKVLDTRSSTIRENLEESERLKREFESEMQKRKAESDEVLKHMRLELEGTRREAEARAKAVLAEAKHEREALLAETQERVTEMKRRLVTDVEADLLQKMEQIVVSVIDERSNQDDLRASIERAWKQIQDERI